MDIDLIEFEALTFISNDKVAQGAILRGVAVAVRRVLRQSGRQITAPQSDDLADILLKDGPNIALQLKSHLANLPPERRKSFQEYLRRPQLDSTGAADKKVAVKKSAAKTKTKKTS